jgi:hypothetical protein
VITAFIFGFHDGKTERMLVAAGAVAVAGAYALIAHFPQAEWNTPHDDDWVTLAALGGVDPVDAQPRQKPGCAGDPVDCAADAVGFGLCDGVRVSPKCAEPRRPAVFAD